MSHPAQRKFCRQVRRRFPEHFRRKVVVDVGSMDINGNNRYLFTRCEYIGIDVMFGLNVDVVGAAHVVMPAVTESVRRKIEAHYRNYNFFEGETIDTMISTEALEHDRHLPLTLQSMYQHLKRGGLLLITCAGEGRAEHGTVGHRPQDSPGTVDYYCNVTMPRFAEILPAHLFKTYHLEHNGTDLQFYGIKL